jgi:hypothetical protein
VVFDPGDILKYQPGDPLFRDVDHVFHFAGIGDIVPSIERAASAVWRTSFSVIQGPATGIQSAVTCSRSSG